MSKKDIPRLSPPSRIGIVGGGQLGRMLTLEAKRMGYYVTVLDPKPQSPAGQVADAQIVAPFSDEAALRELANHSDVLTYEFEHIDAKHLIKLEMQSHRIYPSPRTLQRIQNKYEQKKLLAQLSVPVPKFYKIDSFDALKAAYRTLNGQLVLKSCTGGYDGKGNRIIKEHGQLESAYAAFAGMEMMAEALVNYCMEVSIVVARNRDGLIHYPIAENIHKESILIKSIIPATLPEQTSEQIRDITKCIIEALDDYGVFCIEFFVDAQYNVLVNEIAPRPHNSGHYSIEGCVTSQFEQLVRVITGMPLGSAKLKSPSVMYNILGQERVTGDYRLEGAEALMELEDSHLHLYGKPDAGHLRKLGHITVLGETVEMAEAKARQAISHITIEKPRRKALC
ncbi:5-(carboxyamino)imidazole ribonucleotide synthase [Desulfosporosinus sp.]|uniref:5-(carboxyamino)imidazole ribonucleotide synthase n=1 Tax=Desulfosporosinus sp. TaxID=157907 RepID=UPI0025BA2376|nr:5-(carboxyamino)imidazole ribonucleotide synthase [Desulfosporosinus sp.]MBC2726201.1 5-(carboxyamino)imidazole ribonucleotide synthase [Desulfosporosinus sp.]